MWADHSAEAQDWEANMCKFKVRDRSAVTRKVMWPLFGIAALAVAFRFHARSSLLKGAGFGWDDWTILLSLVLLAAGDATLDESESFSTPRASILSQKHDWLTNVVSDTVWSGQRYLDPPVWRSYPDATC